ncbi:MAG: hypothetical protein WD895_03365 [Acidimicrobiia bacterium]
MGTAEVLVESAVFDRLKASIAESWEENPGFNPEDTYSMEVAVDRVIEILRIYYGNTFDRYVEVLHMEAAVIQPQIDGIDASPLSRALAWAEEVIAQVAKRRDWFEVIKWVQESGFDVVDRETGRKLGEGATG